MINNGSELFGSATLLADGTRAGNGYAALAALDVNHDHKLNAQDAAFGELKVWVDANHDGKTDAGELKGLIELGITALDLSYATSSRTDHGNLVGMISGYETADGKTHEMADVWFTKAGAATTPKLDELLAPAPTDLVPASHATAPAETTTAHAAVADATVATVAAIRHGTPLDEELLRSQNLLF